MRVSGVGGAVSGHGPGGGGEFAGGRQEASHAPSGAHDYQGYLWAFVVVWLWLHTKGILYRGGEARAVNIGSHASKTFSGL